MNHNLLDLMERIIRPMIGDLWRRGALSLNERDELWGRIEDIINKTKKELENDEVGRIT